MKKILLISNHSACYTALFLAFLFVLSGCKQQDGPLLPAKDFSNLTNFDKLRIGSGLNTTVRQGTTRQVLISVPASDEANLVVEQTGGTLVVEINNKQSQSPGTISITMPTLAGVTFSGGVAATITGFSPTSLPVEASGGSVITLMGSIPNLTLGLAGGSRFNGYDAPTTNAIVNLTGGSEARVAVSGTLNLTASGGSRLYYKGEPTIAQTLSGGSSVTKE